MSGFLQSACAVPAARAVPEGERALVEQARLLSQAHGSNATSALLRDRNFALLSDAGHAAEQGLFRSAVEALGGRVSLVLPPAAQAGPADIRNTAAMLGRLYDAVECQGLESAVAADLGAHAGIPVYDGLATPRHPTARLADLLPEGLAAIERRRLVVQAVLLIAVR